MRISPRTLAQVNQYVTELLEINKNSRVAFDDLLSVIEMQVGLLKTLVQTKPISRKNQQALIAVAGLSLLTLDQLNTSFKDEI